MKQLTIAILNTVKLTAVMHLNGGTGFSASTYRNEEYKLVNYTTTDGSPNYKIIENILQTFDGKVVVDLMSKDPHKLENFISQYNEWASKQEILNSDS